MQQVYGRGNVPAQATSSCQAAPISACPAPERPPPGLPSHTKASGTPRTRGTRAFPSLPSLTSGASTPRRPLDAPPPQPGAPKLGDDGSSSPVVICIRAARPSGRARCGAGAGRSASCSAGVEDGGASGPGVGRSFYERGIPVCGVYVGEARASRLAANIAEEVNGGGAGGTLARTLRRPP